MSHFPRQEILRRLQVVPPLVPLIEHFPPGQEELGKSLQPDSYDLRIGFVAADGQRKVTDAEREYMLPPGEMAIGLTKEVVHLPCDCSAELSPPNYLVRDGLLIISPPDVDPGYEGPLTARVINLRDKDYPLRANDHILTIRSCQLVAASDRRYESNRSLEDKKREAVKESRDTVNKLFLDERQVVFRKDLRTETIIQALTWLALLFPIVGIFIPFAFPFFWEVGEIFSIDYPRIFYLISIVFALLVVVPFSMGIGCFGSG